MIISSLSFIPRVIKDKCMAAVQELTEIEYFDFLNFLNFSSKLFVRGPVPIHFEFITFFNISNSSLPTNGFPKVIY